MRHLQNIRMDSPTGWPPLRLRVANAATYILLIIVNAATQTGLLGDDNATISARFPTLLTPAGWAFSIWGIIFLLQGLGVVYQFLPQGYGPDGEKARIINTIGAAASDALSMARPPALGAAANHGGLPVLYRAHAQYRPPLACLQATAGWQAGCLRCSGRRSSSCRARSACGSAWRSYWVPWSVLDALCYACMGEARLCVLVAQSATMAVWSCSARLFVQPVDMSTCKRSVPLDVPSMP